MAGGRPTKYNEEILTKTKEYLTAYQINGDVIPSVEGLAEYINIARSTIYLWAEDEEKQDFSDTLQKINETQKRILLNEGLKGEFNAAITKLALSNNHNMSDKVDNTLSAPGGGPLEVKNTWNLTPISPKKDAD